MRTKGVKGKLACLLLLLLSAFACTAMACGHKHTYASEWKYDQTTHWHNATCNHSTTVSARTAHEFTAQVVTTCDGGGYTVYTCYCGYSYADNPDGAGHSYTAAWSFDTQSHWHAATCEHTGLAVGKAAHEFTDTVVSPCTVDGYTLHTCACGYSYKDTPTAAVGHHVFAEQWSHNATEHWHAATCAHTTEIKDKTAHNFHDTVVPSTATEGGHTERVCEDCEYKTIADETAPLLTFAPSTDKKSYKVASVAADASGAVEIPAEYNGVPVTEIAAEAFAGRAITSLKIPGSVTALSVGMCKGCTQLQTVTIEGNMTAIAASAFQGCTALQTVTLPTTVIEIGALAFKGCEKLATLSIASVQKIGLSAFNGCVLLNIDLPATLREIDEYAFKGCAALDELTVPATVTVMKEQAFANCTELATLTVKAPLIGNAAFQGCAKLGTVTLQNVQVVGSNAFDGCTLLSTLALPESVTHVGAGAFDGTGLLSNDGGVKYACGVAMGYANNAVASVTLKAGTVGIAEGAFRENTTTHTLGEVIFADTVRFISANAFRGCTSLTSVDLPSTLTTIGMGAFRGSGLTSVTIANTVKTVGDYAFFDCWSLTSADVSAEHIGDFAFSASVTAHTPQDDSHKTAALENLTLGEGVKTIGNAAFQYCKITQVTIPASVTKIGQHAFYGCASLATVTFTATSGWKAGNTSLAEGDLTAQNLKVTHAEEVWTRTAA